MAGKIKISELVQLCNFTTGKEVVAHFQAGSWLKSEIQTDSNLFDLKLMG